MELDAKEEREFNIKQATLHIGKGTFEIVEI